MTNFDKDIQQLEHLYTVGKNVKWCTCYEKQHGGSQSFKIQLPCDPAILLQTYLKELKSESQRDISMHVFPAELSTIAKLWEQHKMSIHK